MPRFDVANARRLQAECDRVDALPPGREQSKAMMALLVRLARLQREVPGEEIDRVCREAEQTTEGQL